MRQSSEQTTTIPSTRPPFGHPFTVSERAEAVRLYSKPLSLAEVARVLGRSPSGVYKILKEESCPIRKREKVPERLRQEILRLYYAKGLSSPSIAGHLGVAKFTVLYWLRRSGNPLSDSIRAAAGSLSVSLSSGSVDLLPLVTQRHLRWVDDTELILRVGNSRREAISRYTSAKDFFRLAGFYLAEGSKVGSSATLTNTNLSLTALYRRIALSFISSEVTIQAVLPDGRRSPRERIIFGGICIKTLLLNAAEGILSFICESTESQARALGLSFLNGFSDGDGSVTRSRQAKSEKLRVALRLTEGNLKWAVELRKAVRRLLGVGGMYKPRNRNYYDVIASLNPQTAALLLSNGFFSEHHENRRRLALKALDSAYVSRFVLLYRLFGPSSFSWLDLARLAPGIRPDFIGRAVIGGKLVPSGIAVAKGEGFHWCRAYKLSADIQILANLILEATEGEEAFAKGTEHQPHRTGSKYRQVQQVSKAPKLRESGLGTEDSPLC